MEGRQVDGQGGLLHVALSLRAARHLAGQGPHARRRLGRHQVLVHTALGQARQQRGLDRRRHADFLLVRPRRRRRHRSRQLQQVPQQLLPRHAHTRLLQRGHMPAQRLRHLFRARLHGQGERQDHRRGGRLRARAGVCRLPERHQSAAHIAILVRSVLSHAALHRPR